MAPLYLFCLSGAILAAGISQGKSTTLGFDTRWSRFMVRCAFPMSSTPRPLGSIPTVIHPSLSDSFDCSGSGMTGKNEISLHAVLRQVSGALQQWWSMLA